MGAYVYRIKKNPSFKTVQGDEIHRAIFQIRHGYNCDIRPSNITEPVLFVAGETTSAGDYVVLYNGGTGVFIDDHVDTNDIDGDFSFAGHMIPHKKRFKMVAGKPDQFQQRAIELVDKASKNYKATGSFGAFSGDGFMSYELEERTLGINLNDEEYEIINFDMFPEYPTFDEFNAKVAEVYAFLSKFEEKKKQETVSL